MCLVEVQSLTVVMDVNQFKNEKRVANGSYSEIFSYDHDERGKVVVKKFKATGSADNRNTIEKTYV